MDISLSKLQETVKYRKGWHAAVHGVSKSWTRLNDWTTTIYIKYLTKVWRVKATVFPVVMYGCESWTIKKTEHWRIDAFELWCWRRPFRVPWTVGRSRQSTLKEINPEYSLEGLMLKLKLQNIGHLMRADLLEKTLMLRKIEGRKRRGRQRMRWLDGIINHHHPSSTQWTWVWANSKR